MNAQDYRSVKLRLRPIVMWDGEGVTQHDGRHNYIMLANSKSEVLESNTQLDTFAIFDFLWDHRGPKNQLNIGFALGYDVAMWLKPLSGFDRVQTGPDTYVDGKTTISLIYRKTASESITIYSGEFVYEISYRARKCFELRRRLADGARRNAVHGQRSNNVDSFTLWDVWGYYQSSFVLALEKNAIPFDKENMAAMKDRRGSFSVEESATIRGYCISECIAGARLYKKTLLQCLDVSLVPTRHDGPGALAATLYRRESIKQHIYLECEAVRVPVAVAYFGGRIECAAIGSFNDIRGYDIASAYPAQIQHLPSLLGVWDHSTVGHTYGPGRRVLYRLQYEFARGLAFYPLPYRNHTGAVVFAAEGEGWYWDCEYLAALHWCERFDQPPPAIRESWSLSDDGIRPFSFVPKIFDQRAELKRHGNGAEMALKLTLNSLYGKTAQQLGGSLEKLPPYFSLVWAGMITAGTRAELLRMACLAQDPHDVIAFMTDGIYTKRELPQVAYEGCLGAWELPERYDEAVFVQAGVYWTRQGANDWKPRYRGFDKKAMATPSKVVQAWREGRTSIEMDTRRFASYGAALMSKRLWSQRGTWIDVPRSLRLDGRSAKRLQNPNIYSTQNVSLEVRPNISYINDGRISMPYDAITLAPEEIEAKIVLADIEEYLL